MENAQPKAVFWFKVYAAFMAVIYWLFVGLGIFMIFFTSAQEGMDPGESLIMGVLFCIVGLAIALPYTAAVFLKPKPWVWVLDIVLICFGLAGCLTLVACIPLLIYWLKPEIKAHFGRS